jgi:NAD(P)-dependent dehydrogenase (short-subunit alcohol dehydrogenase family)
MMKRLKGKAILVAGAGAIGNELARRYAVEGASVVVGDLDEDIAKAAVDVITSEGGTAIATRLDGSDEASLGAAVALCRSSFGGVDGAHLNYVAFENNLADDGVLELPMESFDKLMHVNVRGFFLATRAVLPAMIARGGGSIIYTSSTAAYDGGRQRVAYAISKTAILALMRHVATRHGPDGIRANAIAPGFIAWPNRPDIYTPEIVEHARSGQRIKSRIGRPADIAAMGAHLMSDDGAFITGQTFAVDGGLTMRA